MPGMDTKDTPKPAAATTPALPADDPRLTRAAIEHRRTNGIVERDEHGRLLPGSQQCAIKENCTPQRAATRQSLGA